MKRINPNDESFRLSHRIPKKLRTRFNEVARDQGRRPAVVLRELMENFSNQNSRVA